MFGESSAIVSGCGLRRVLKKVQHVNFGFSTKVDFDVAAEVRCVDKDMEIRNIIILVRRHQFKSRECS